MFSRSLGSWSYFCRLEGSNQKSGEIGQRAGTLYIEDQDRSPALYGSL